LFNKVIACMAWRTDSISDTCRSYTQSLSLRHNQIRVIEGLSHLTTLTLLDLYENQLSSIAALSNTFPNLTYVLEQQSTTIIHDLDGEIVDDEMHGEIVDDEMHGEIVDDEMHGLHVRPLIERAICCTRSLCSALVLTVCD
jgi:hypothetical protein